MYFRYIAQIWVVCLLRVYGSLLIGLLAKERLIEYDIGSQILQYFWERVEYKN
jgi:hypothetical protein